MSQQLHPQVNVYTQVLNKGVTKSSFVYNQSSWSLKMTMTTTMVWLWSGKTLISLEWLVVEAKVGVLLLDDQVGLYLR